MNSPYNDSFALQFRDGSLELERRRFNKKVTYKTHVVLDGEDLLDIAFKYYGDKGSWGIIADYNGIQDILEEVTTGKEILIPEI